VISVIAKTRGRFSNGGRRGRQCGHGPRAANRMCKFMLGCRPPPIVAWLTSLEPLGPSTVKKRLKVFLKRLEKHLGHPIAALAKLEPQGRLACEVGTVFWLAEPAALMETPFNELWTATIEGAGRVVVEPVRDWNRLASYLSKTVTVGSQDIFVGHRNYPILSKEYITEASVPGVHTSPVASSASGGSATSDSVDASVPPLSPVPDSVGIPAAIHCAWADYAGHYSVRHRPSLIPRHPRVTAVVSDETAAELRAAVNKKRRDFFIGSDDGFTVRGTDVEAALVTLPALQYASEVYPGPYLQRKENL